MLSAVSLELGPAVPTDKTMSDLPLRGYVEYVKEMQRRGYLLVGGPYVDQRGGLAIVRTRNSDEARRLTMLNAAAYAGLLVVDWLHAWHPLHTRPAATGLYYVATYELGPAAPPDTPISELPLAAHLEYAQQQFDDGKLLMAGLFTDANGAMLILNADSEDEARAIVATDPAIVGQSFTLSTLRSWYLVFGGGTQVSDD